MEFEQIEKKYRPIPFWSWNEKLSVDETRQQVRVMDMAGIGGFFMHARGGLQTEYMGSEWFDNVSAAIEEGKKAGMRPWAYDENGWPSGFGDGKVNSLGIDYQQKYLRMADKETCQNRKICWSGDHYFYYDVNPFYVDTLDANVTRAFLESAYEPYYRYYGNEIEGFFTDEPQISRDGIPWSFVFEEEYQNRWGQNLLEHLEELFLPIGDYKTTRVQFWKMVTDLFSQNFMKQIYDWCDERGLKLTGHMVEEDTLLSQLTANGACMPHYEYFHIPGMDWLGRSIYPCLTPMQVSSVAEQLGKEAVLSETFALCGHNVSFAELKGIYEWQMVHGINLLCQHLQGYTNRGLRKRDYPPAMYIQQPWWPVYHRFVEAISRQGMVLNQGENSVDVLVLHPQTTAWAYFDNGENRGIDALNRKFLNTLQVLEEKHIAYHLGDETILQRHGKVKNGKLVVGKQSYSYVINGGCEILLDSTHALLDQFFREGGRYSTPEDLPENPVVDSKYITYTSRNCNGFNVYFFVNTSPNVVRANILVPGRQLDITTGKLQHYDPCHRFEPWGSLMIIDDGTVNEPPADPEPTLISLDGDWNLTGPVENAMTLDHCDYYFDGVLQEKNGYVLNICERANELCCPVQILQEYRVSAEYIPDSLKLVCETPERFQIQVNGQDIDSVPDGWFRDKSFKTLEIAPYMYPGQNTISFTCNFKQNREVYENIRKASVFESEKNKLVYDMEIEAVYLVGDFSVRTDGKWTPLERSAMRYEGEFVLTAPRKTVTLKNLEQQGFPFFSGSLTLEGTLEIQGENPVLDVACKGINGFTLEIGDTTKTMLAGDRLALSAFGVNGRTKARLTIYNNLRNLLGPHHQTVGEDYYVGPWCFYQEKCIWCPEPNWNAGYCFVETGLCEEG